MMTFQVVEVNFPEIMATIDVCNNIPSPDTGQSSQEEKEEDGGVSLSRVNILSLTRGILPGTLWCGVDDMAADFSKLGRDRELDRCCRAHDHCPVKVREGRANLVLSRNFINYLLIKKDVCLFRSGSVSGFKVCQ